MLLTFPVRFLKISNKRGGSVVKNLNIYPGGAEEHVCAGRGMREEVRLRVRLEKGSTKFKTSKDRARKKSREEINVHLLTSFCGPETLWMGSPLIFSTLPFCS